MDNKITIEFAHICENVIVAKNGNLSIINIFNQINSADFPAAHPKIIILVALSREKPESEDGKYQISIKIVQKEQKENEEQNIIAKLDNKDVIIPELPAQIRFFANFSPVVFPKEGAYEVIISVNNDEKKKLGIEVNKKI